MISDEIRELLLKKAALYNQPDFIASDPIVIPHQYSKKQDIEIAGFFAAVLAWGQRKTIIMKCRELFSLMDHAPYDFMLNHTERDLTSLLHFRHRTFNDVDLLYFIAFFQNYYQHHQSLEQVFYEGLQTGGTMKHALIHFHNAFFSLEYAPARTRKHIATPARKSACKRLNMFLRWMVRKDDSGVDFGIWNKLTPADLICPCDLHVDRVARSLGLVTRKQTDWVTAEELTSNLRILDPQDPVRFDFALFGMGIFERGA